MRQFTWKAESQKYPRSLDKSDKIDDLIHRCREPPLSGEPRSILSSSRSFHELRNEKSGSFSEICMTRLTTSSPYIDILHHREAAEENVEPDHEGTMPTRTKPRATQMMVR